MCTGSYRRQNLWSWNNLFWVENCQECQIIRCQISGILLYLGMILTKENCVHEKLKSRWNWFMLATTWTGIFCLPMCCLTMLWLKYTELWLCLLFCVVVQLYMSHYETDRGCVWEDIYVLIYSGNSYVIRNVTVKDVFVFLYYMKYTEGDMRLTRWLNLQNFKFSVYVSYHEASRNK